MIQFNFNAKTIILAETLQPLYHKLATSYNLGKKEKKRELGKTRFRWKSSESIHPSLEWTRILLCHSPSNTIMRSWSWIYTANIFSKQKRASKIRTVFHIFDWLIFHYFLQLIFRLIPLTSAAKSNQKLFSSVLTFDSL